MSYSNPVNTEIREEFFKNFSQRFSLEKTGSNVNNGKSLYAALEEIPPESINECVKDFFEQKKYSVRNTKMNGGFMIKKGVETIILSITNFSGERPSSIMVSMEIFQW